MKKLKIKSPCHENWDEFTQKPEGGFCSSCQKTVIDFTNKSNSEIQTILLAKKGQNLCGRIGLDQIDSFNETFNLWHNHQSSKVFQSRFLWALILSFGITLFTAQEAQAQTMLGKISYVENHDTTKVVSKEASTVDTTKIEEFLLGEIEEYSVPPDSNKNAPTSNNKNKVCKPVHKLKHPIIMGMIAMPEPKEIKKSPSSHSSESKPKL